MPPLNSIVKYAKNVRNCRSLKSLREMANAYIVRINRESTVPSTVSTMVFRYEAVSYTHLEEGSLKTSVPRVYAGGDAVTGAATVILAMGAGKEGAEEIDKLLSEA